MTDWDKELAKIDKQLASISDEQLMAGAAQAPAAAPGAPRGATKGPTKALPAAAPSVSASVASGRPWMAWIKVTIAVAAAAGLMFWPWPGRCGLPLIGFTAATGGVALLGVWSAVGTWRHRLGLAHVASLLVTVWGLGLGMREVLPRVGYAIPSTERPAQWSCEGLPQTTAPTVTPDATSPNPALPPADAGAGTGAGADVDAGAGSPTSPNPGGGASSGTPTGTSFPG